MKVVRLAMALAMVVTCQVVDVFAANPGYLPLESNQLFTIQNENGKFTCGLINGKWLSGKLKPDGVSFIANKTLVKNNKVAMAKASGSKLAKLALKHKKLQLTEKKGRICKDGPPDSGGVIPQPTVPPGNSKPPVGPTPTPTSPPSATGNFLPNGDVTAKGKQLFQIPSSLNANINAGKSIALSNSCAGCHAEKNNRNFTTLSLAVPGSPMFIQLSQQEFADLTAYLNRFRPF